LLRGNEMKRWTNGLDRSRGRALRQVDDTGKDRATYLLIGGRADLPNLAHQHCAGRCGEYGGRIGDGQQASGERDLR